MNFFQQLLIIVAILFSVQELTYSQYTAIPDPIFEQELINANIDSEGTLDGQILTSDAAGTVVLILNNKGINNMTGIEAFVGLSYFSCYGNNLMSLDVSNMSNLSSFFCRSNNLTSLDLSSNSNLTTVDAQQNDLTSLTLGTHPNLGTLYAQFNDIGSVDLTGCTGSLSAYFQNNNLASLNISGLTNLEYLRCNTNSITSLDVSNCNSLVELNCSGNPISMLNFPVSNAMEILNTNGTSLGSLDLSNLVGLKELYCSNNNIPNLDVSNLLALEVLTCNSSNITDLDVSNTPNLGSIICNFNAISELDVTGLTALTNLDCSSNDIEVLEIGSASNLLNLNCSFNEIISLDLSLATSLVDYSLRYNSLEILNIKNGNNTNYASFTAIGNSDLCCISVDDPVWAETNLTNVDTGVDFELNCPACNIDYTAIPDSNFEQVLINQGIDSEGTLDGQIITMDANNKTGTLNLTNSNISDLTGISAFTSISGLDCSANPLASVNITTLTQLTLLDCGQTMLTNLDVSSLTQLTSLDCRQTMLTSLNLNGLTALENLTCIQSNLSTINFGTHPVLTSISASTTDFTSLDLTGLPALQSVIAAGCDLLTSIDVSGLSNLETLSISSNSVLNSLDVSGCSALKTLYCNQGNLASLNLAGLTAIETVHCYDNNISTLTLGSNPALTYLNCAQNVITALDVSSYPSLEELWCYTSPNLVTIDASNCPNLEQLILTGNSMMTQVDVAGSTNLIKLDCNGGALNTIDLTGQSSMEELNFQQCNLSVLDIIDCSQLKKLYAGWNNLSEIDLSNSNLLENIDLRLNDINALETEHLSQLKTLNMINNDLVYLDLSASPLLFSLNVLVNDLISLNVKNGNNTNFLSFNAQGNSNLSCIEVDDPSWAAANWPDIDAGADFNLDCPGFCTTLTYPVDGANDANPSNDLSWIGLPTADGYKLNIGTCTGCTDIANNLDIGNVTSYSHATFDYRATIYVTIIPYIGTTDGEGCLEESFSFENGTINWTGAVRDQANNKLWSKVNVYKPGTKELVASLASGAGHSFNFQIPPGIYNVWATPHQFYTGAVEKVTLDLTGNLEEDIIIPPVSTTEYIETVEWDNMAVYGDGTNSSFVKVEADNLFNIDSMFVGLYSRMFDPNELNTKVTEGGLIKGKFLLLDDGQGNDELAGDGIFSSGNLDFDYTNDYARENAIDIYSFSFFQIYENGTPSWVKYTLGLTIGIVNPTAIVNDPLEQLSDDIFVNDYIINHVNEFICQEDVIYDIFLDTFDFVNMYLPEVPVSAAQHFRSKNEIQGIGLPIFDNNFSTGSAGKLMGKNTLPKMRSYYAVNHETMHQWANGMETLFPPVTGNPGHYGYSSVFGVVGGIGPTVTIVDGNTVNFSSLRPSGRQGNFETFSDLELYAMGVLDFADLRSEYINVTDPVYVDNNNWDVTSITTVVPQDILDEYGPRLPAPNTNVPEFRTASLVCSSKPLSPAAVDFFTYHAAAFEGSIVEEAMSFDECASFKADMITLLPAAKYGCTDPLAHNYASYADVDDGTCETCTDDILNGDETVIDCGGNFCDLCTVLGGDCPNLLNLNTETIITGLYKAENEVSSTNVLNGNLNIQYKAGSNVSLEPGFYLPKTTSFEADIKNCIPD